MGPRSRRRVIPPHCNMALLYAMFDMEPWSRADLADDSNSEAGHQQLVQGGQQIPPGDTLHSAAGTHLLI